MNARVLKFHLQIKNNETNESYKLCHVRGKQTVGGIVFYKHLFLVFLEIEPLLRGGGALLILCCTMYIPKALLPRPRYNVECRRSNVTGI